MHATVTELSRLDDAALLVAVSHKVQDNRAALVQLLRYLGEVDARRLYAREGHASLFAFCQALNFSESEAYKRCVVSRAGRRYPRLIEAICTGDLHLTGAAMIAPKMTEQNEAMLLKEARHQSKRALEAILARLFPVSGAPRRAVVRAVSFTPVPGAPGAQSFDAEASGRRQGAPAPVRGEGPLAAAEPAPQGAVTAGQRSLFAPTPAPWTNLQTAADAQAMSSHLSVAPALGGGGGGGGFEHAEAYRLHVTLDAAGYALLGEAQALLSHKLPQGDLGQVIGLALGALVDELQRRKHGRLKKGTRAEASRTSSDSHMAPSHAVRSAAAGEGQQDLEPGEPRKSPRVARGAVDSPVPASVAPSVRQTQAGTVPPQASQQSVRAQSVRSRQLARLVKRTVYKRDGGACTYVAASGRRCGSKVFLEYHHRHAFALGGANDADNVTLHCRAHNALAAVADFGQVHQQHAVGRRTRGTATVSSGPLSRE